MDKRTKYVYLNGLYYIVTEISSSDDKANAYLEEHHDEGVLTELSDLIYIVRLDDAGIDEIPDYKNSEVVIESRWVVETGRWDKEKNMFVDRHKDYFNKTIAMYIQDSQYSDEKVLQFEGGPTGYESYFIPDILSNTKPNYDTDEMCICGGTINRWPACYVNRSDVMNFLSACQLDNYNKDQYEKIYEVIFEDSAREEIKTIVEYIQAPDFCTVSTAMIRRADELNWELKSCRYLITISETLESSL